jgi:predicted PurR-regulated permease PerM
MVMLAYIFGPLLFGWYGIFLGPMLLVLLVHFVALVLPELLAGAPIEPQAIADPMAPKETSEESE